MQNKHVPIKVRYSRFQIYFCNYLFLFGLVFTLCSVGAAIYVTNDIIISKLDNCKLDGSTNGIIVRVDTVMSGSGEGPGGVSYYKFVYTYNVGKLKFVDNGYNDQLVYQLSDSINVHYDSQQPSISSAKELGRSRFNDEYFPLMWIMSLFGLVIILYSLKWSRKFINVIDSGFITTAYIVRSNKSSNNESESFVHYYCFYDNIGKLRKVKSYSMRKEEKTEILVLYSVRNASNNLVLRDFIFIGNRNLKNQIYSAANK
jgi:hypothetical protein